MADKTKNKTFDTFLKELASRTFIKKALLALTLGVVAAGHPASAQAANEGINFGGTISPNTFCRIFIRRTGTFVPSADNLQLSSTFPGGQTGIADVWSFPAYDVTAETVPFFVNSAPSGGNTGVSMDVQFRGQSLLNGINFGWQSGSNPQTLNFGFSATRVNVHLTASRPTPFPPGNYSTVVTMRCD